jgi:hypothetical protein
MKVTIKLSVIHQPGNLIYIQVFKSHMESNETYTTTHNNTLRASNLQSTILITWYIIM